MNTEKKADNELKDIALAEEKDKELSKEKEKPEEHKKESKKEEPKKTEAEKEGLTDSDMIDINKQEETVSEEKKKAGRGLGGKNAPKTTNDFIAKQKKRKRTKRIVILAIVVIIILAIIFWIRNTMNKAKDMLAGLQANSVQTAFVEKKTLYDSKDATGTLYALETKTISRILNNAGTSGAEITAVNVSVGDHVEAGDVLVEFSSENIEKDIAEAKEDIGTQKKLDAIAAEDSQRTYVSSYTSAANDIQDAAEKVDRALEKLHDACNDYGDAKRERDEARDMDEEDLAKKYGINEKEKVLSNLQDTVDRMYQAQLEAQRNYDAAVEAQARTINEDQVNKLSSADSTYKRDQIKAGETVKDLQRKLNNSIDSLDDYIVYATISGVVTDVNVTEGNTFSNGNVLTIQDDSGYKVDVLIDEYDIPKVKKAYTEKKANGQELEVVVKTDATGDNEYKGHVTLISPTSTATTTGGGSSNSSGGSSSGLSGSSSSTANYKISIELDENDDAFMIGMSAKVAIVVNKSPENSLCVPYNCVEQTEDGRFIVKVMDENGDKNTADDLGLNMGKSDSDSNGAARRSAGPNTSGIVVEVGPAEHDADESKPEKKGLFGKKEKSDEVELGRRYREVEVDKIFDTDYYAAVVPKTAGSLKEGDEVMIVTQKANGNDFMAMFGPGDAGVY